MIRLNHGFTLLELIVAMALSSVIVLAMLHLLVWSHRNIKQQQALLIGINKIRFINYYLTRELHKPYMKISNDHDPNKLNLTIKGRLVKSFYIDKAYHRDNKGHCVTSLFERQPDKRRIELVANIIKIRIQYFKKRIKIWLLARSETPVFKQAQRYFFDGTYYTSHDHYFYFSWPVVIKLADNAKR